VKRGLRIVLLLVWLVLSWTVLLYHRTTLAPPPIRYADQDLEPHGWFYPKEQYGLNQLFLKGTPYARGVAAGRLTKDLLKREEDSLIKQFTSFFPNVFYRWGLTVGLMRYFWGIDRFAEPAMLEEMYGVSLSAPPQYDRLLSPYTRQLAYHGLHEVGQMFVDFGDPSMACTLFAVPYEKSWLIGRNFDFEGGKVFDEDKILKWVFPTVGHRYLSVIWGGMVGAVTGVNDAGVYISINAAGSTDYRRYGMPTTLVVTKALEESANAEAAVEIIKSATTFITDIFVVADREHAYRIEKSPRRVAVEPIERPTVVANHLLSPLWKEDKINHYRTTELTSQARFDRGEKLLAATKTPNPEVMARWLRDKGEHEGKSLPLGNRRAIDALIATHAVIYDAAKGILYVSQGPAVTGKFIGYDLAATFGSTGPAKAVREIAADPEVSEKRYRSVKGADRLLGAAEKMAKAGHCEDAFRALTQAEALYAESSHFFSVRGDVQNCRREKTAAIESWKEAIRRVPAYPREVRDLEGRIRNATQVP
jgi:hypothetical protein